LTQWHRTLLFGDGFATLHSQIPYASLQKPSTYQARAAGLLLQHAEDVSAASAQDNDGTLDSLAIIPTAFKKQIATAAGNNMLQDNDEVPNSTQRLQWLTSRIIWRTKT
jgi:hypothetical protein